MSREAICFHVSAASLKLHARPPGVACRLLKNIRIAGAIGYDDYRRGRRVFPDRIHDGGQDARATRSWSSRYGCQVSGRELLLLVPCVYILNELPQMCPLE